MNAEQLINKLCESEGQQLQQLLGPDYDVEVIESGGSPDDDAIEIRALGNNRKWIRWDYSQVYLWYNGGQQIKRIGNAPNVRSVVRHVLANI